MISSQTRLETVVLGHCRSHKDSMQICRGGTTCYMNSMAYVLLTTSPDQLQASIPMPVTTVWAASYLRTGERTHRPQILLLVFGPIHACGQSTLMLRKRPRWHTLLNAGERPSKVMPCVST